MQQEYYDWGVSLTPRTTPHKHSNKVPILQVDAAHWTLTSNSIPCLKCHLPKREETAHLRHSTVILRSEA
jgi:hypothetical protein